MTKQFKFVKIICIVLVIAILALAFAVGFPAIGAAILFNSGGSTGATDIVAMILKKYS